MNRTNLATTLLLRKTYDDTVIIYVAEGFCILGIVLATFILATIVFHRNFHTVTHILVGNTCVWSVLYCVTQLIQFTYRMFVQWNTSVVLCRLRGYFSYMTIAGVHYSYLIQAISRLFFIVLSNKHHSVVSIKVCLLLILIQWIIAILLVSPAIITSDIIFIPKTLCWVGLHHSLHTKYTLIAYYAAPMISVVIIYAYVYYRMRHVTAQAFASDTNKRRHRRNLEVLRNITILFGIYLFGGLPTTIYLFTQIGLLQLLGLIFPCVSVVVEKSATLYLDRKLLTPFKTRFGRTATQITPSIA